MKLPNTIKIWVTISKDKTIQMFSEIPVRGKRSWIGEFYINSMVFKSIEHIIKNSSLNWNSEPEFLELNFSN